MDSKASLRLLILLFLFSAVISRNLKEIDPEGGSLHLPESRYSEMQDFAVRRLLPEEGGIQETPSFVEGRMDFERNDYSGTGANNHHDPKPPGSV